MFHDSRVRTIEHSVGGGAGALLALYPNSLNFDGVNFDKIILGGFTIVGISLASSKAGTIGVYEYVDGATGLPIKGGANSRFHELTLAALGTSFAKRNLRSECGSTGALPGAFVSGLVAGNNRRWSNSFSAGNNIDFRQQITCLHGGVVHVATAASDLSLAVHYIPGQSPGYRLKQNLRTFSTAQGEGYTVIPVHV